MADSERSAAEIYRRKSERERQARIVAEELLEKKSLELYETNRRLALLNEELEARVCERTSQLEHAQTSALLLAERDHLTQLANRHSFAKSLGDIVTGHADNAHFSLILLDLDGFKQLNDTFGHAAGDAMLKACAARLLNYLGENHIVARLGGDEFAIVRFDQHQETDADILAECSSLLKAVAKPVNCGDFTLRCGVTIGVSRFPSHSRDCAKLQIYADLALYDAKEKGRGRVAIFAEELWGQQKKKRELGAHLREALNLGEVQLFFQPIVNFDDPERLGVEALVRWRHARLGWVSPVDVLDAVRSHHLHAQFFKYVVTTALTNAKPMLDSGQIEWVSINLTAEDIRDSSFTEDILEIFKLTGVPAHKVHLEITEDALVTDILKTKHAMNCLIQHGSSFSIDDFGTGYSNLISLRSLPFKFLKVDRSFVAEMIAESDTKAIVMATVGMARALNLEVIAEGIETVEQLDHVRALGCEWGQGFLFGRGIPVLQAPAQFEIVKDQLRKPKFKLIANDRR